MIQPSKAAEEIIELDAIKISPSRFEQYESSYPGSVTVIDQEEIETSQKTHVVDFLREQLGVDVSQKAPNPSKIEASSAIAMLIIRPL